MTDVTADGTSPRTTAAAHVRRPRRQNELRLLELWTFRRLIPYFAKVYIERRYRRTWLGWLWLPLRPSIEVASRVLLFGGFLGVASGDRPYFMFFIVGAAAWQLFAVSTMWATRSLEINKTVLERSGVPRITAVIGALGPGLLECALYGSLGLIGAIYYSFSHGTSYLALSTATGTALLGLLLLGAYAIAIGLWTAPIALRARDVRFLLMYLLGFWFLVTPVIYPKSFIPEKYRPIAEYNPLSAPIEFVQYGVLQTAPPSTTSVVVSLVVLAVLLVGGLVVFSRNEATAVARR